MIKKYEGYLISTIEYNGPRWLRPIVFWYLRLQGWRRCSGPVFGDNYLVR